MRHLTERRAYLRDHLLRIHVSGDHERQILGDVVVVMEPLDEGRGRPGKLVLVDRKG